MLAKKNNSKNKKKQYTTTQIRARRIPLKNRWIPERKRKRASENTWKKNTHTLRREKKMSVYLLVFLFTWFIDHTKNRIWGSFVGCCRVLVELLLLVFADVSYYYYLDKLIFWNERKRQNGHDTYMWDNCMVVLLLFSVFFSFRNFSKVNETDSHSARTPKCLFVCLLFWLNCCDNLIALCDRIEWKKGRANEKKKQVASRKPCASTRSE